MDVIIKQEPTGDELEDIMTDEETGDTSQPLVKVEGGCGEMEAIPLPGDNNYEAVSSGDLFVKQEETYSCAICPYATQRLYDVKVHVATHTGDKKFSCHFCDYQCISSNSMIRHVRIHTGEKPYACDLCDFRASQVGSLRTHQLTHTGEKRFTCEECDIKFVTKSSLTRHVRRMHTKPDEKRYACEFCDFKTVTSYSLKNHVMRHTGDRPYACELCDYKARQKSALDQHMVYHRGVRRYACDECDLKFYSNGHLRTHKNAHEKTKNKLLKEKNLLYVRKSQSEYECKVCGHVGKTAWHLDNHVRTHTGEKPFLCKECDKRFASKTELNRHNKRHLKKPPAYDDCDVRMTSETKNQAGPQPKPSDCNDVIKEDMNELPSNFESSTSNTLRAHVKSHRADEERFSCDHCGFCSTSKRALKEHIQSMHLRIGKELSEYAAVSKSADPFVKEEQLDEGAGPTHDHRMLPHYSSTSPMDNSTQPPGPANLKEGPIEDYELESKEVKTDGEAEPTNSQLGAALESPGAPNKYSCKICDFTTTHERALHRHFQSQHPTGAPLTCDVCGREFLRKADLTRHYTIHGEKLYACGFCDYRCSTASHLRRHVNLHTREKMYSCSSCDFTAISYSSLHSHKIVHHSDLKRFECYNCGYKCKFKSYLIRHLRKHTGEKPFACDVCDFRTACKTNFKIHCLKHEGIRPHPCEFCDYRAVTASFLKVHMKSHEGEKPFACSVCDYRSRYKEGLKKHFRQHTGETTHACNLCDYKCRTAAALKRHISKHTGERPFACSLCEYKSSCKTNLRSHVIFNHSEISYRFFCDLCDYKCRDARSLRDHSWVHTGEKLHACEMCDHRASNRRHLLAHIKKVHGLQETPTCFQCGLGFRNKALLQMHIAASHPL